MSAACPRRRRCSCWRVWASPPSSRRSVRRTCADRPLVRRGLLLYAACLLLAPPLRLAPALPRARLLRRAAGAASTTARPAARPTPLTAPLRFFCLAAVWERLEAENPEFFAAYHAQLEATASLERCHL